MPVLPPLRTSGRSHSLFCGLAGDSHKSEIAKHVTDRHLFRLKTMIVSLFVFCFLLLSLPDDHSAVVGAITWDTALVAGPDATMFNSNGEKLKFGSITAKDEPIGSRNATAPSEHNQTSSNR
ncbi:unnamed protein product [Soboliphyme baturini]|uniref:DOMON domain-containing protein n=1 Tax=Soboliphyme baturini TaxID=241478 RepID=A0A183J7Z0_9BILA|nr:unnamed protein product [Soboliphyme baturini]